MGPAGITPDFLYTRRFKRAGLNAPDFLIFLEFQDVGLHGDIVGEVLLCDPQQA